MIESTMNVCVFGCILFTSRLSSDDGKDGIQCLILEAISSGKAKVFVLKDRISVRVKNITGYNRTCGRSIYPVMIREMAYSQM